MYSIPLCYTGEPGDVGKRHQALNSYDSSAGTKTLLEDVETAVNNNNRNVLITHLKVSMRLQ